MRTFFAPILVATFVVAGCSSDPEESKFSTSSQFSQALADAECASVTRKCGTDLAACLTKRKNYWDQRALDNAPRTYTSARADACVSAWRSAHEDGELTAAEFDHGTAGSAADTCERVFQGAAAKDQACTSDYDCIGDLRCDEIGASTASPTRLCATRTEKKLGEGCANAGEVCAKGSYCAAQGELRNCITRRTKDQMCSPSELCSEEFRCDGGVCKDKFISGATCSSSEDCASSAPLCVEAAGVKKCRPALSFGLDSPACDPYK